MRDWTEQEEQEMIQRAKDGDPEANYELSQWAQQRAEEEPDEPRWNRLAAKCLLKAAQAGYGPAKAQMEELLIPRQQLPEEEPEIGQTPARPQSRGARGPRPAPPVKEDEDPWEDEYDYEDEYDDEPGGSAPATRRDWSAVNPLRRLNDMFASWGDAQWKRMQIVCVALCVVLAILIVSMIVTRPKKNAAGDGETTMPTAEAVEPQAAPNGDPTAGGDITAVVTPNSSENDAPPEETGDYPTQDIIDSIEGSGLEVKPDPAYYVTKPTTAVVSVNNVLFLRMGPSTSFDPPIAEMSSGARVEIFAIMDDWALVRYNGNTWGWCSKNYLVED